MDIALNINDWSSPFRVDDAWPSRESNLPKADDDVSTALRRRVFENGQAACNVEAVWRGAIEKFDRRVDKCLAVAEHVEELDTELGIAFEKLAKNWKAQTRASSSVNSMVMHPAYLEIISYGEKIIPFILRDLQKAPSHWFVALRILARTSPVKPEDAGNVKKMTEAWLAWGRENGKLS